MIKYAKKDNFYSIFPMGKIPNNWEELTKEEYDKHFEKTLDELKAEKLAELTAITSKYTINNCGEMHITSSLGYTINADKTAQDNIRGLIEAHGESDIIKYKIYDNSFKEVTIADLKIMLKECAKNGENLYTQKFLYQEKIKACKTIKELEKITFDFVMLDFSKE